MGKVKRSSAVSIFQKPLVCVGGKKRPLGLPEYIGSESCDVSKSREVLKHVYDQYQEACEPLLTGKRVWPNGKIIFTNEEVCNQKPDGVISIDSSTAFSMLDLPCSEVVSKGFDGCGSDYQTIPIVLGEFGLLDIEHPLFDIVHRLNIDQIQDFRSANAFIKVAETMGPVLHNANQRELTITYPAAGSHLTPLIVGMGLIDEGTIDSANYTYTEIDDSAPHRVAEYLRAMTGVVGELKVQTTVYSLSKPKASGKMKKITQFKGLTKRKKGSYETKFLWSYRGKSMSLTLAIRMSGFSYSRDEYLEKANLLVFHDITTAPAPIITHAIELRENSGDVSPMWTIADRSRDLREKISSDAHLEIDASYGCRGVGGGYTHWYDFQTWAVSGDRFIKRKRRGLDPFRGVENVHVNIGRGAELFHLK